MFGFLGHTAKKGCRRCHKEGIKVCVGGGIVYLPHEDSENCSDAATFIELECTKRRYDSETRDAWSKIRNLKSRNFRGQKKAVSELIKTTGIKRKPLLSKLSLDFVESLPYDPMHLCLLGWVKLVAALSTGFHSKVAQLRSSYAVSTTVLDSMNTSLSSGSRGIPSSWGRPPLSLSSLSHYKAEDLKNLGLFSGPILFSEDACNEDVTTTRVLNAEFLQIVFDPTPKRDDVEVLQRVLHSAYTSFCDSFYLNSEHSFCFMPTTHAILHVPDMLRECGPLLNVSQFLMERFIGELGPMLKSYKKAESNLFNKNFTLFSLRLLNRGTVLKPGQKRNESQKRIHDHEARSQDGDDPLSSHSTMNGHSKLVGGKERRKTALGFIERMLPITAYSVSINSIQSFKKATLGLPGRLLILRLKPASFHGRKVHFTGGRWHGNSEAKILDRW